MGADTTTAGGPSGGETESKRGPVRSRQQHWMRQAYVAVSTMKSRPEDVKRIYGSLCHEVPILIRTNGLCQTLALVEEKAHAPEGKLDGDEGRAAAYRAIRQHVAAVIGVSEDDLLTTVRNASLADYMRHTRTILGASVYYKRFAVSILDVEPGADKDRP